MCLQKKIEVKINLVDLSPAVIKVQLFKIQKSK